METLGQDLYKKIGEPKFICAPMVDQSELAFRMLSRKYGTNLCYTPMLHSRVTVQDKNYLNENFTTCAEDRPLFVQFCGNDPDTLLEAAKMVEDRCDAVDINLGCPQGIARKGHYGSFLLGDPALIGRMVEKLAKNLKVPVTCKIRILPKEEDTFHLVRTIVEAGCSLLTVHGRTKEQNKQKVGKSDWDMIKKIKEMVKIPVFANGGIYTYEDAVECLKYTGVDGIMSSEALLENPALFNGKIEDLDRVGLEYIEMALKYKADVAQVRAHMFKILYAGLSIHTDLREAMTKAKTIEEFRDLAIQLQKRRDGVEPKDKLGWYLRYMPAESKDRYNNHLLQLNGPKSLERRGSDKIEEEKANKEVKTEEVVENNILSDMFN
jgi:tRNA-dihydrouridine synthase 1